MTRIRLFSSLVFAGSVLAAITLPSSASVFEDARKVCQDRFNDEQKSGSVPKGMSKSRYLSQCQNSYVRSVKLENQLNGASNANEDGSNALSKDGQGGPEILVPVTPPVHAKKTPAKPVPRFKPTI